MAKPNKNRKRLYDNYKSQGRRERNKKRKAEKLKKQLAVYAARREDPEYQKARAKRKEARDPNDVPAQVVKAERIGGWKSMMDQISYRQEQEEKAVRKVYSKMKEDK